MNKPKISICVPVHNAEKFLPYFLDSALLQTFGDYEIVLVDNHSTDGSLAILRSYESAFPDKIFVYEAAKKGGAGVGRNLAFQKSKGEYIFWCDADDLIHPCALEAFYEEAEKYNADIVCGEAFELQEKDDEAIRFFPIMNKTNSEVTTERLIADGTHFWNRIIKRELIERLGEMPYKDIFEDVRYLGTLNTYAVNIRYIDVRVYYWYKRTTSTTFNVRKSLCEDSIRADRYLLAHCNSEYLDAVRNFVAFRNFCYLEIYWQYFDLFVNWICEQSAWFYGRGLIQNNPTVYERLKWADHLAEVVMPNIIYVNGFRNGPTEERLRELKENVFHDDSEIVILTEQNCDLSENPYILKAYQAGKFDFVAGYFALLNIYKRGGVYLDARIRILNYFGVLKYQRAFFALTDQKTYSDWIYGAPARNEVIASLLDTYTERWDQDYTYLSLSERISTILTVEYDMPLDGVPRLFCDPVSILPPDLTVVDTRFGDETKLCIFEHDLSSFAGQDGYITMSRSTLEWMMRSTGGEVIRNIDHRYEDMMNTNTGRLMLKIRQIGDGPYGPFLKKIFHAFLRVYRLIKR